MFVSFEENVGLLGHMIFRDFVSVRVSTDAQGLRVGANGVYMSTWVKLGAANRLNVFQCRNGLKLWFVWIRCTPTPGFILKEKRITN